VREYAFLWGIARKEWRRGRQDLMILASDEHAENKSAPFLKTPFLFRLVSRPRRGLTP